MNLNRETQFKAKAYQKKRQRLHLFELVWAPAVLFLIAFSPVSAWLKAQALELSAQPYGTAALYFIFYSLLMLVIDFPLSVYSGFFLEKKFDLSNQNFAAWFLVFLKKSALSLGFTLLLVLGLYAVIWNFPETWWLLGWCGFSIVSFVLGKLFPVVIVPLFYKYGPVTDEVLKQRILDLSSRYGLPLANVYSINLSKTTKKANAAFMGMGKTKRVVLSDTLIERFTHDEIETVVAHELGHFKNHDIWKQLTLGFIVSFAGFWTVSRLIGPAAEALGYSGVSDIAAMPLLFLIFYGFHLILTPMQNGFSRWIERAADRFALKAFPHKDAFISCMEKLAEVNLADPDPHPAYEWFFHDHPAISKRIRMAREIPLT